MTRIVFDGDLPHTLLVIREVLQRYANADAGVVRLLAGFKATPEMRDPHSLAEAALALLDSALASDQGWLPIETAPRDGTRVLLWSSDKDVCSEPYAKLSRWHEGFWRGVGFNFSANATHWQPLPTPPSQPTRSHQTQGSAE